MTKPPDPLSAPQARKVTPRFNVAALAVFIFLPFVGAVLGLSGGATDLESRREQGFPDLREAPLDEARWADVGKWFEDRLPARATAIDLEARSARLVGGREAGNELVGLGTGGWLFYKASLNQACISSDGERSLLAEIEVAGRLLESTGRRLVVSIAPDRATVASRQLGGLDAECVQQNRVVVENLADHPDVIDLADAVGGTAHALTLDTHWSPSGAIAAAELIVDAIQPGLWEEPDLIVTSIDRSGDLQRFLQDDGFEVIEYPRFDRQDASQVAEVETPAANFPMLESLTPGGDELNVVLLHDSFGGNREADGGTAVGLAAEYIRPWFENFTSIRLPQDGAPLIGQAPVAARIAEADVVALLFVQRLLPNHLAHGQVVAPLVSALIHELDAQPLSTETTGEGQITMPTSDAGVVVLDDLEPGLTTELSVTATAGAILGRVDMDERVVLHVDEGTVLTLGPEASSVMFVALP